MPSAGSGAAGWRVAALFAALGPRAVGRRIGAEAPFAVGPPIPDAAPAALPLHLAAGIDVRGGALGPPGASSPVVDLSRVAVPLLTNAMVVAPPPTVHAEHEVAKHLATDGLDIQAAAAAVQAAERQQSRRCDSRTSRKRRIARRVRIEHMKDELHHMVRSAANFALGVSSKTTPALFRRRPDTGMTPVLRISDAVESTPKGLRATGESLDLSGDTLAAIADLDVSAEFGAGSAAAVPRRRITLLGLVSALSHNRVFEEVQRLMRPSPFHGPHMNIETFKHTLGVDSAAGLVRTLARKYMNHDVLLSVFLEVYTLVALPMEPTFFQVAWGMRVASALLLKPLAVPRADGIANTMSGAYHCVEMGLRVFQLAMMCKKIAMFGTLDVRDHIEAINNLLVLILFEHEEHITDLSYAMQQDMFSDE